MECLGTKDQVDIWYPAHNGLTLLAGHTPPHADDEVGLEPLEVSGSTEIGEDLLLGLLTDRAGVKQDDICIFWVVGGLYGLGGRQDIHHFGGVVFIHLAPKGADVEFGCQCNGWRKRRHEKNGMLRGTER